MYCNRFQAGDSVQYSGTKESMAKRLNGEEGFVLARVQGTEREVVVAFGDAAYIVDEMDDLSKFIRRARPEGHDHKGPEVQKRKGISEQANKKGGKRRNQEEG